LAIPHGEIGAAGASRRRAWRNSWTDDAVTGTQRGEWDLERARLTIGALSSMPGALLPILHELQAEFGYVPDEATPLIADALNLSRAEVVGVVHFYHDFRTTPGGRHTVQVCRAEACQAVGADALAAHAETRLGVPMGDTTEDGAVTLRAVYCLGNCALGPAVMVDGRLCGRVTPERFDALLASVEAGTGRPA
jgi:formate dehydrogenase subunit gamma